jgi:hypothetical protein
VPDGVPNYYAPGEYQKFVNLRAELYSKYVDGAREVSEFGCGIGHNLVPLDKSIPRLRGFDWSDEAVRRTRALGFEAQTFNMLRPNFDVKIEGVAMTIHAMEQLGTRWGPFVQYLCMNKPLLCLHIEPIEEFYDPNDSHDAACIAYHQRRGYLSGFLNGLLRMVVAKEAELIEARKSPFGGYNHDAYSVIVWRPL